MSLGHSISQKCDMWQNPAKDAVVDVHHVQSYIKVWACVKFDSLIGMVWGNFLYFFGEKGKEDILWPPLSIFLSRVGCGDTSWRILKSACIKWSGLLDVSRATLLLSWPTCKEGSKICRVGGNQYQYEEPKCSCHYATRWSAWGVVRSLLQDRSCGKP